MIADASSWAPPHVRLRQPLRSYAGEVRDWISVAAAMKRPVRVIEHTHANRTRLRLLAACAPPLDAVLNASEKSPGFNRHRLLRLGSERRKEAESKHNREPDPPHEHLDWMAGGRIAEPLGVGVDGGA